jgi:hypothetical protein
MILPEERPRWDKDSIHDHGKLVSSSVQKAGIAVMLFEHADGLMTRIYTTEAKMIELTQQ